MLQLRPADAAAGCGGPCRLTAYVRVETRPDGLYVLPQCSAPGEPAPVLDEVSRGAPYRLVSGKLAARSVARLDGRDGARLTLRIADWWPPASPPPRAWAAWLYARSLTVAYAKKYGVVVDVYGGQGCERWRQQPYVFEACRATRGGPLSLLMDPSVPSFLDGRTLRVPQSTGWWLRQRLLSPVKADAFQGFAGRLAADFAHLACDAVKKRIQPFITRLAARGVKVERLMAGASLTVGPQYYPQTPIIALATVARCAHLDQTLGQELQILDREPGLDWQNRYRIEVLKGWLRGVDTVSSDFRRFVPELPKALSDGGQADARCQEGLLGPPSLRSAG